MKDIDEVYCFKWYKDMYLRQGCTETDASKRARIDLNYQLSLYKMCEVFGIEDEDNSI
jgi:hypothetical protein